MRTYGLDKTLDLLIVGAGPAALVTLHEAKQAGLSAIAVDKGPVCGALVKHPTYMQWFSTADKLELSGFPLLVNEKNPTRREYLKYCRAFVKYFGLEVVTYREITSVQKNGALFTVEAKDRYSRGYTWQTRNVITGTGFYDSPRGLGVPGADLPKVTHVFSEAHYYADHDVLIVGSGNSAAEVALELWREGARVTVAMRGDRFTTKYWIEPDIENRIKEGSIACHRNAALKEIRMDDAVLTTDAGEVVVACDFVLAMTGYEPDTSLLESIGAVVDQETKKPELNEHFETTVPGLFVIGTLCAGCESNVVFIENSREHGPAIVRYLIEKGKRPAEPAPVESGP